MNKLAYELGNQLAEFMKPYDVDRAMSQDAYDSLVKGMEYNRTHSPGQYLLNPMVRGPVREGITRMARRHNAFMGDSPYLYGGAKTLGTLGALALEKDMGTPSLEKVAPALAAMYAPDLAAAILGGDESQENMRTLARKFKKDM